MIIKKLIIKIKYENGYQSDKMKNMSLILFDEFEDVLDNHFEKCEDF